MGLEPGGTPRDKAGRKARKNAGTPNSRTLGGGWSCKGKDGRDGVGDLAFSTRGLGASRCPLCFGSPQSCTISSGNRSFIKAQAPEVAERWRCRGLMART